MADFLPNRPARIRPRGTAFCNPRGSARRQRAAARHELPPAGDRDARKTRYGELGGSAELGMGRGPKPARESTLSSEANDLASSARVWRYAYSKIARRASKLA